MGLKSHRDRTPNPSTSGTLALGPQRGLGAIGDVEHAEDAREVRFDGLLRDEQTARDEAVPSKSQPPEWPCDNGAYGFGASPAIDPWGANPRELATSRLLDTGVRRV